MRRVVYVTSLDPNLPGPDASGACLFIFSQKQTSPADISHLLDPQHRTFQMRACACSLSLDRLLVYVSCVFVCRV